ncbi:DUF3319 domain-containing protein [Shewanella sp. Scap07]|uniref:DUF3319 domain-containing protein n=1 Tax=Shewanella sp. Scap07 TaxID=2589987 RepID=UPI0015BBF9B1|nr:DUF3319 domain-containing protein [Shewanella sp. Scap07]QLE84753.1 DUF3319 domain-containing protein [Shewanella sp. Scap07]
MKKLIYQGYILTNSQGNTDSWKLTIGEQQRIGSLFELRRQIQFYEQLGVLPELRTSLLADKTAINATANNPPQSQTSIKKRR